MTTNNFQVAEIQEKVESLENEEKSIQSQIDEVCLTFIVSVFKSLQFYIPYVVTALIFFSVRGAEIICCVNQKSL